MIVTNTDFITGKKISKVIGLVKGNTIRSRWLGSDIAAGIKNLIGGEIKSYTDMMAQAREEATARMVADAKSIGADAVINVRFASSEVAEGASEILAYGTAVKIR